MNNTIKDKTKNFAINHSITPAMVGSWQAQEAVKIILKKGGLLRNKLLYIDGERGTVEIINLERRNGKGGV